MPTNERSFFLLAGHIQNELYMFNRILTWCIAKSDEPALASRASMLQGITVGKSFAGKLLEAWNAIQRGYFGTKLSKEFSDNLPDNAQTALKDLGRYFSRDRNIIYLVRNEFANHYSPNLFEEHWKSAAREEGFESIIGPNLGSNMHFGSEYVANIALFNSIYENDFSKAFEQFIEDLFWVFGCESTFFDEFLDFIFLHRFPEYRDESTVSEMEIQAQFNSIKIPFFSNI